MISGTSGFPGLETMPTAFLADAGFAMLKMELYRSQKSEVRSRKSEGRSKTAIAECILDCRFWTLILNSDFCILTSSELCIEQKLSISFRTLQW